MRPVPAVLEWLNRECDGLARLEGIEADGGVLRSVALEGLRRAYPFPLRVTLTGYVGDVRHLGDGHGGTVRYLEIVPNGLSPRAAAVLGGVLVRCDRPLHPGSVVEVTVEISDPGTYSLHPPALLAHLLELKAMVAVEP